MNHAEAVTRAITLAKRYGETYYAVERYDHPHITGPYCYAVAASLKTAWTKDERVLVVALGAGKETAVLRAIGAMAGAQTL